MDHALPSRIVTLSAGPIELVELGPRTGDPVLFVHGALVTGAIWSPVAQRLAARGLRCLVPTLPLGSHRHAMHASAPLGPEAVADLVIELLDGLSIDRAILVGNDSGGAISQIATARHPSRVARLVLTNCDALEVFPPAAFAYLKWISSTPILAAALARTLARFPSLGLTPLAYGWLGRDLTRADIAAWVAPGARDAGVRRDLASFFREASPAHTLAAAERLATARVPVHLVWGTADRFFRLELARRLQAKIPGATLEPIEGARTYAMLDAPDRVALAIARAIDAPRAAEARA